MSNQCRNCGRDVNNNYTPYTNAYGNKTNAKNDSSSSKISNSLSSSSSTSLSQQSSVAASTSASATIATGVTNILLVLIVSITCVQTKEIKNSLIPAQISETNHSSIENSSISNNQFNDHALDNNSTWPIQCTNNTTCEIESTINLAKHFDTNTTSQSNQSTPLLTDEQINQFNNSIRNDDHSEISDNNELYQSELPKAIQNESELDNVQDELTTERIGKDSDVFKSALRVAARQGLEAMNDLYNKKEPNLIRKGLFLPFDHPGAKLSQFSLPALDETHNSSKAAYAALFAAKSLKSSLNIDFSEKGRESPSKISLRRTSLEAFCPPRDQPFCSPISRRYRTYDGTCNNARKGRWGSAQMPFNRFQMPIYADGIEELRQSVLGGALPSPRFISLVVHGSRETDSPVTLMLAQWGQFIDHDLTSTLQPRSINGSVPQCCGVSELHPNCAPIKVPTDDPWLGSLGIRCLEFLRSAPAQRRDCLLSWREQTNQVTSFLDASTIYSSSERSSERSRLFQNGFLLYGRGSPKDDVCLRGAFSNQCIRPGDMRSGEQPGLLAMHHVWVLEHNRIAGELAEMNLHWSDEKIFQETRRIIGAMVQHITYREFLPLVLGREVCKLFDLELHSTGYYNQYDSRVNPTVANAFSAAAFRFGHSLIQNTYMRSTRNHEFLDNNVTLHEENARGDIGSAGSLHRLLRGLSLQRAQKRDEFITVELTNHLFQSGSFPFGLDLAAINIQRGRDHGLPSYTAWREPCGLTPITNWDDLERVVGPKSMHRMRHAYSSIDDIDLFVGGLAERPVVGGLVGPVFACIIAQQFSNLRKGDRFWYENGDFENSFTPAQLQSIRQVNLAQVLCRTLGSGTLQPHVFLPHTVLTNEHVSCGTGSLTPLDLNPWLERDPFSKNSQSTSESSVKSNDGQTTRAPQIHAIKTKDQLIIKVDLAPSKNTLDRKINRPNVTRTTIDNKLDLDTIRSQSNRLKPTVVTKANTRPNTQTNRPKKKKRKTNTTTVKPNTTTTTKRTKKRKNKNRVKHKRDVSDVTNEKARSSIVIKIDKQTVEITTSKTQNLSSKRRIDKDNLGKMADKEYVIVTPDQNLYDIEIKIKPKQPQSSTNQKIVVQTNPTDEPTNSYNTYFDNTKTSTTRRPQQFYEIAQPSLSGGSQYNAQDEGIVKPHKPTYIYDTYKPLSILVKRTTTPRSTATSKRPYICNYHYQNDEQTQRPYYSIKKPFGGYGSNDQDIQQNDNKPFYSYPTVQNADTSSYYTSNSGTNQHDEFQNSKPYQTKPQHDNFYMNRPSVGKPSNHNYGQNDDIETSYTQNMRPSQDDSQNSNYGPTYFDDFSTKRPIKLTTTFTVQDYNNDEYYDGYGSGTTSRPYDLTTFYTVQTTKKKRQPNRRTTSRPIRPAYNQNDDEHDEVDEDDDNDDDAGDTGYFNPSSVLTNIMDTFNGYFGSASTTTTTRKPYITQQDNFYTYPSIPSNDDFPYSRQRDVDTLKKRSHRRIARRSDNDYERTTYRAALNEHFNDDISNDSTDEIAFDRDGYLRPEYMNYNTKKMHFNRNVYDDAIEQIDIEDIQTTSLHAMTNATDKHRRPFDNRHRVHSLLDEQFENGRHRKQITTLTDDNRNKGQHVRFVASATDRTSGLVPLVPLNVLTKPERPDNWVMYDAKHIVPLPRMPQFNDDHEDTISSEMPRPFMDQRSVNIG